MNRGLRLTLTGLLAALTAICASADRLPGAGVDYLVRYESILKSVPALELPARAAQLVAAAKGLEKEPVGLAIVDVVAKLNPSALPTVVGAISRTEPGLSTKLANEAAALQPKLATSIKAATIIVSQGANNKSAPAGVSDPQLSSNGNGNGNGNGNNGYENGNGNGNANGNGADNTNGNGKKKGHYKDN